MTDQFIFMNALSSFELRVLDNKSEPIDLDLVDLFVATALEWSTPRIELLDSNTGISVVNANTATIQVEIFPTSDKGYRAGNAVYQLLARYKSDNLARICEAGRLFISASIEANT